MKIFSQLIVLSILLLALIHSTWSWSQTRTGQLKGGEQLSNELASRWLQVDKKFPLLQPIKNDQGLAVLLGAYAKEGAEYHFMNGSPTSLNWVLYQLIMESWTKQLTGFCQSGRPRIPINRDFRQALHRLCGWNGGAGSFDQAWSAFYTLTLGPTVPESEWQPFKKFVLAQERPHQVENGILALLLHPYLLMEF